MLILTGSGLPIPEEVPIIAAGIGSAVGTLNPWGAFVSCLVGALAGDSVIYAIGYHFGHTLVVKHPRYAHWLHVEHEARIEEMIRRHGLKVFFVSRFMVGIRAPVYLTAGILRMSFRRFLLIDACCATAVVSVFFGLSYAYGERLADWLRRSEITFTVAIVVGACVVLCIFLWRRRRRRLSDKVEGEPQEACSVGAAESTETRS